MPTVIAIAAVLAVGVALGRWWPASTDIPAGSDTAEKEVLYWQAPMDASFRRDAPGKSPMGMDLVPVYAVDAASEDAGVVSIDPRIVNNLGIRTASAELSPLSRRIETVGYVGYDEDTVHHVHTRVDGWIEELSIKASGDRVQRGQVLFALYSPTLVNAQEEYLAALKSRNSALHEASRERLAALGVAADEIERLDRERSVKQRLQVLAHSDGVVAHLGVREGIYVTPSMDVMSIANLDRVWVLVEVFERQSAWLKEGQKAEVELDYLPGVRLTGEVDYIYPELDSGTRTVKARLRFDNAGETLRPNMFARVMIYGTPTSPVVHVPREALIRGGETNRVVLALPDGKFKAQPVEVGIEAGDRVEILSGLSADDSVVTSGQFLIDSESNIESALARLGPADNAVTTDDHAGHAMPSEPAPQDHSGHHGMSMDHGADRGVSDEQLPEDHSEHYDVSLERDAEHRISAEQESQDHSEHEGMSMDHAADKEESPR
ncbi:MAG: efflux RND transporter periplasmic adaptor subunit [Woeseia sp.]